MTIATDFEVQANGNIRHVAGTDKFTVIELHRRLGDLMDDAAAAGDDLLDITDATASERSTDNIITLKAPFNIDDTAAQFLYDGSIIQDNGNVIYDGLVVIANAGMPLEIVQNGALVTPNFWGTGINADAASGYSHRFMLKVRTAGADIDGRRIIGQTRNFAFSFSEFRIGTGTQRGNNVLALTYASDLNNQTAVGTVAGWTTISNTEGFRSIDVDGNATPENYYSEWNRATFTINQFYERVKWLSRAGSASTIYGLNGELFRGITHEITLDTLDDTGVTALAIDATLQLTRAAGSFVTNGFVVGEKVRLSGFTTAANNSDRVIATVAALVVTFSSTTGLVTEAAGVDERMQGLFDDVEAVSWTGGTGRMLAINSRTAATKMWIQLLTGVAPTDNQVITGVTSLATSMVNVTVTERDVPTKGSLPFCGQSTGSSLVGSYGLGIEAADLSASDKLFDLTNTQRTPPNNVTFTVGGLVNGEDRVLVANLGYDIAYTTEAGGPFTDNETVTFSGGATARLGTVIDNGTTGYMNIRMLTGTVPAAAATITGGTSLATAVIGSIVAGIDEEQLLNNALLNGAAVTSVVCIAAIPTDTPITGTIRIKRTNGVVTRHPYSAYSGSTFTITAHDFSTNTAPANTGIYISYLDLLAAGTSASFTGVYLADRSLFIRVRDGGGTPIKTFETTGTLGSAGGSSTAIRTSDT